MTDNTLESGDTLDGERLIPDSEFRALLGGVSAMSVWRWERDDPTFPKPYRIGNRKCRRLADARTWIASKQTTPERGAA